MATWRCPVCATSVPWPPTGPCAGCAAPLHSDLGAGVAEVERELAALHDRHRTLVDALRAAAAAGSVVPPVLPEAPPTAAPPTAAPPTAATVTAATVTAAPPTAAPAGAPSGSASAPGATDAVTSRLSSWTAQVVLAASGAGLLTLAAIVFLAVTWTRLGGLGRAGVLLGATVLAGTTTRWLRGRELSSTAEALAGLTVALTIVVAAAVRIEGVGGADELRLSVYVTAAGSLAAGGLLAWARWARTAIGQVGAVLIALITAVTAPLAAVDSSALPGHAYPLLLTLVAMALCAGAPLVTTASARRVGHVGVAMMVVIAGVGALVTASDGPFGWALAAAVVLSGALWWRGQPIHLASALATGVPSGVIALGVVQALYGRPVAPVALAGVALLCAAAVAALPTRRLPAAAGVAPVVAAAVLIGAAPVLDAYAAALDALLQSPWGSPAAAVGPDWAAVATLVLGFCGAAVLAGRSGIVHGRVISAAVLALGAASGIAAATLTVGAGWAGQVAVGTALLGTGALLPRMGRAESAWRRVTADLTLAVGSAWVLLWALSNRWATVLAVGVLAVAAGLLGRRWSSRLVTDTASWTGGRPPASHPGPTLLPIASPKPVAPPAPGTAADIIAVAWTVAAGAAISLPMVIAAAATWPGVAGGAVAVSGACTAAAAGPLSVVRKQLLTVPSTWVQGPAALAAAGALVTALWWTVERTGGPLLLPGVAYVLTAGVAATALLAGRLGLIHAAAATAAIGTAALLSDASVTTPELYALTPAAVTGALGLWRLYTDEHVGSSTALRVPLALLLAPTVLQVVADPFDWVRVVALVAATVLLGIAGAALRWTAFVVASAGCAVVLMLTQGWVAAVAVPRWVAFAVGGVVLIGVSATYERQRNRLRTARERLVALR
jgi:hypothetical protein